MLKKPTPLMTDMSTPPVLSFIKPMKLGESCEESILSSNPTLYVRFSGNKVTKETLENWKSSRLTLD